MPDRSVAASVCRYCRYRLHDGWAGLLAYDDVYQSAVGGESEATYGFHESWDDLREELY
jgi:hypothetical protein